MTLIGVVAYPKSGTHLVQQLLRYGGVESTHTHNLHERDIRANDADLHVIRDIRGIVPSAICHMVFQRPEKRPEIIRPHVEDMVEAMLDDWKGLMLQKGATWSDYVRLGMQKARHTVTYEDLVERPREALLPLVDIGPDAQREVAADTAALRAIKHDKAAWRSPYMLRQGNPYGWRETLTQEQQDRIAEVFAEGLELHRQVRESVGSLATL